MSPFGVTQSSPILDVVVVVAVDIGVNIVVLVSLVNGSLNPSFLPRCLVNHQPMQSFKSRHNRAIEGDDDHRHAKVVMVDAVDHGLNSGSGTTDANTMLRQDAAELTPTKTSNSH